MYTDFDAWKQRQEATVEAWPEYVKALDLVSKRGYVSGDGGTVPVGEGHHDIECGQGEHHMEEGPAVSHLKRNIFFRRL